MQAYINIETFKAQNFAIDYPGTISHNKNHKRVTIGLTALKIYEYVRIFANDIITLPQLSYEA